MNPAFDRLYRQLARATVGLLLAVLAVRGLILLFIRLDLPQAVISFRGVAESLEYAFAALFVTFLAGSLAAAVVRWAVHRDAPKAPRSV